MRIFNILLRLYMSWSNINLYVDTVNFFFLNPHYENYMDNIKHLNTIFKSFIHIVKRKYSVQKYNNDLKNLRHKIYMSKKPNDLSIILKYMTSTFCCYSTDDLSDVLMKCFTFSPLSELELQKLSIWQQTNEFDIGMDSFSSTLFWICAIQSVMELENKRNG